VGVFVLQHSPVGYGHGLPFVYLLWFIALLILYLPCKSDMAFKSRHQGWVWLSYLSVSPNKLSPIFRDHSNAVILVVTNKTIPRVNKRKSPCRLAEIVAAAFLLAEFVACSVEVFCFLKTAGRKQDRTVRLRLDCSFSATEIRIKFRTPGWLIPTVFFKICSLLVICNWIYTSCANPIAR